MDNRLERQSISINRTSRGTVEFVIQEGQLKLVPQYRSGNVVALLLNNHTRFMLGQADGPWTLVSEYKEAKIALPIKSVSLDPSGKLTIKTIRD
jgi:hypothetical protein